MQSDKIRIVSEPWNHWYHCTASTYGTWLRGDPRGWRARHHREHVEGDYRNPPPPGTYAAMLAQSKKLMKRPAVHLPNEVRTLVLNEFVSKLQSFELDVVIAALDDHHLHILARFPHHNPRHHLGIAKKHTSHILREFQGGLSDGGIWSKRSKCIPIRNRAHQVNVARYIHAHKNKGASVWRA